jgi:hypothetical protein
MTARNSFVYMKNFPVVTANAYEGTLTRYTGAVTPTGGIAEGAAVYQYALEKGDLVELYTSEDEAGRLTVQKLVAANEKNYAHGIAVSEPFGVDNSTASGATPADAYQRKVDVAFFGLGIIELEANGAIPVGSGVELSESEDNIVGDDGTDGENGGWIAMTEGAKGVKLAILVGFSGYQPAD